MKNKLLLFKDYLSTILEPPFAVFIQFLTVISITVIYAYFEHMEINKVMTTLTGKLNYILVGYLIAFSLVMFFLLLKNLHSKINYVLKIVVTTTFGTVLVSSGFVAGLAVYSLKFDGSLSSPIVQKVFAFFITLWIITLISKWILEKILQDIELKVKINKNNSKEA